MFEEKFKYLIIILSNLTPVFAFSFLIYIFAYIIGDTNVHEFVCIMDL